MPKLKEDKKLYRGQSDFHYSKDIICCKWYYNKPVLFLATIVDNMRGASNAMKQIKDSDTETPVFCPDIIKLYNSSMSGVDIMDLKAPSYRSDHKNQYCFYLRMFFDLIDVTLVSSQFVYTKLDNDISLLNLKTVVAKVLIQ